MINAEAMNSVTEKKHRRRFILTKTVMAGIPVLVQQGMAAEAIAARIGCQSDTMTNATMTASLTPAVMPARHLGPVAIFQWPLAWAMICLLLAVDFVWASQVGLTIGGGVNARPAWIGALLALSAACRRRNRGIANMAEACCFVVRFHRHGCRAELPRC